MIRSIRAGSSGKLLGNFSTIARHSRARVDGEKAANGLDGPRSPPVAANADGACKVCSANYFCERVFIWPTPLEEKKRLLKRVRRIMGQVAAIEKALDQEGPSSAVSTAQLGKKRLERRRLDV
jgi:hypothetical protein